MPLLINYKDLSLSFFDDARNEIIILENKLYKLMKDFEGYTNSIQIENSSNVLFSEDKIDVGCKVEIEYQNDFSRTGRVWYINIKKDEFGINKDGLVNYENISSKRLKNLSVGIKGQMEKDIWVTKTLLENYQEILKDVALYELRLMDGIYIIEVIQIDFSRPCDIIYYTEAKTLLSGQIKLPHKTVIDIGFYELKIFNGKLIQIQISCKTAFELMHKS